MVIGVCTIELRIHGGRSLKEKRRVLRSVKDRIRNRFNVSIAEVGYLDKWQRALHGFVAIINDRNHVTGLLESVVSAVDSMGVAEIVDDEIEIL